MDTNLLNQPWEVQVALASGYVAYFVAHQGNRSHHQTIDVAFTTLVFGLFASAAYGVLTTWFGKIPSGLAALFFSLCLGAAWKKLGRPAFRKLSRRFRISYSDDDPSALVTMMSDTRHDITQIAVRLVDGRYLRCDDTSKFSKAPFGPCIIGPTGDLAIYTTHEDEIVGATKQQSTVDDPDYGQRITYIPSGQIAQVYLRHKKNA
jgi:hypothetical protein